MHFSNTVYSGFAKIDPAHNNMVRTDDPSVALEGYIFYIGKGIVSGLQEATGIEGLQDIALEIISSYGLSLAAGALVDAPMVLAVIAVLVAVVAVISSSFMAAQAIKGIYSTIEDDTSTSYQKAEDYAHDAVLLIASVCAIVGSAKALLNSVKTLQTVLNDLKGRKTRFQPEELLDQPSDDNISLKEIKRIVSYDDFINCVSKYLDEDALKYLHANMNSSSENTSFLRKMAKASLESSQSLGDTKLNKTDIAFGLDILMESNSVDEAVKTMIRCSNTKLDRYGNFHEVLKKQDLTLEKFDDLKIKNVDTLNSTAEGKRDLKKLRAIRDSIPNPTNETMLRKTIPFQDIEKYIGENGWNTIRGYIARDGDVSHLKGYQKVRNSLRLDYTDQNGNMPFPPDGDTYGYIKFHSDEANLLEIPYGKGVFKGGTNDDGYPCTRNGFLGSKNGEIIPEWWVKDRGMITPENGAELHQVIKGNDTIIAIYNKGHFFRVPE